MAATLKKPKLITIVGPTASGKSALAQDLAKLIPTEIIAADSRTVYRGMDIGTAKPSETEVKTVPHWGLDLREPGEAFSAYDFQLYAKAKIKEILSRKRTPVIVGGTGLYVDSILYDYQFPESDTNERELLQNRGTEELQKIIIDMNLPLPTNHRNKRHLIRTIERQGRLGKQKPLDNQYLVVGLLPPDEILKGNINSRADKIFAQGVLDETRQLLKKHGKVKLLATGGIVYKICIQVLEGEISEQTATTLSKTAEWQYAKRQKTWYKKNNDVIWFADRDTAISHLKTLLNT